MLYAMKCFAIDAAIFCRVLLDRKAEFVDLQNNEAMCSYAGVLKHVES